MRLNSYGESIVEVLMVVVILGSALTTAFVITNKATNTNRGSLERSEATSFAQSQLEQLHAILAGPPKPADLNTLHGDFCVTDTGDLQAVSAPANPGVHCTASNRYKTYTSYAADIYTTNVTWDAPGGGQSSVNLIYRDYEATN